MYVIIQEGLYLKKDGNHTPNINKAKIFKNSKDFCNETKNIPLTDLLRVGITVSLTRDNTNHYVLLNKDGRSYVKDGESTYLLKEATVFNKYVDSFPQVREEFVPVNCKVELYPLGEHS